MRALTRILPLLVTLVAAGRAGAELPHLVLRLAADAAQALPTAKDKADPADAAVAKKGDRLGVTGTALVPTPPKDVAAYTRVTGFASRALQPRVVIQTPVVHALKVTPMFPLGAYLTFEYAVPFKH
jgi:hypothetical protein